MPRLIGELSDNFSWDEASVTQHRDIDNSIPLEIIPAVKFTANRMEYVRALLNSPILINSWYRCPELNKIVGGAENSQHMQGCAVDFKAPRFGGPLDICQKIIKYADLINFDQLIYEYSWVHISFSPIPNTVGRKQVLTLLNSKKYAQGLTNKDGTALS